MSSDKCNYCGNTVDVNLAIIDQEICVPLTGVSYLKNVYYCDIICLESDEQDEEEE